MLIRYTINNGEQNISLKTSILLVILFSPVSNLDDTKEKPQRKNRINIVDK